MRILGCENNGSRTRDAVVKVKQMMKAGHETAHRPPMRSRSEMGLGSGTGAAAGHRVKDSSKFDPEIRVRRLPDTEAQGDPTDGVLDSAFRDAAPSGNLSIAQALSDHSQCVGLRVAEAVGERRISDELATRLVQRRGHRIDEQLDIC